MSDQSVVVYIKDKILPPLMVAFIIGAVSVGIAAYRKLDQLGVALEAQASRTTILETRMSRAEADVTVLRSQMVGWDTLTRMERALAAMSAMGKGNESMAAMSAALRAEIEARKEQR